MIRDVLQRIGAQISAVYPNSTHANWPHPPNTSRTKPLSSRLPLDQTSTLAHVIAVGRQNVAIVQQSGVEVPANRIPRPPFSSMRARCCPKGDLEVVEDIPVRHIPSES